MTRSSKARSVFYIILGFAALAIKRHYSGSFAEVVYSYGGNISASFAAYFLVRILTLGWKNAGLVTATIALVAAELFEATTGFGVMTNVYDPVDFVVNALGVGLALLLDTLSGSM